MSIRKLLREPFVHFFIIGVVLFGIDAMLRGQTETESEGEIVVTEGRIASLAAVFEKTWQRPPTEPELQSLVNNYVLDEALFRQGVEMGVDQDDSVIRRRVRQKLDFLIDDLATPAEPDDAVLQVWLDDNVENHIVPAMYSFIQVYLNPERHGDGLDAEVDRLLAELGSPNANIDVSAIGDATLLETSFVDIRSDMVASGFGGAFAVQLASAPVGRWSGPYESAFGVHLVFMNDKAPSRAPNLDEVRDAVARDWRSAQRDAAVAEFHKETVAKYDVTIEWPSTDAAEASE